MIRFCGVFTVIFVFFGLAACGASPTPAPLQPAKSAPPHDRLIPIVERYWDEHISPESVTSPQALADALAVERQYLAEISALPPQTLDPGSRLTYDIFKRQRELLVQGFTYPSELLAPNPFDGMPIQLASAAARMRRSPPTRVADYDEWLSRIDAYDLWTKSAISNMRQGLRRGYSSPRPMVERMLPVLEHLAQDTADSVFYLSLRSMPDSIKDPDRTRLTEKLTQAVKEKVFPAYRELHDFLLREYLPRARSSLGLSALPLGNAWYAYLVKVNSGSTLTPNEIHGVGLGEVERLHAHMATNSAGAAPAAPATLDAYSELKVQVLAAMPTLFSTVPPADFEIRAAESFTGGLPRLTYEPAGPGRKSAVIYVELNTAGAQTLPLPISSFLREAIPGRHYQSALQQSRTDLPRFRRFDAEPAFVEGWGLYAASLGEELGLYSTDESRSAALLLQLSCAVASVVDTGLHAQGWTRQQAFDYLHAQLAMDDGAGNHLIDQLAASPGKALACEMGEIKIQALRNRAQQVLGARFDVREFHSEILKDGAMPLDILETKIKVWIESKR